MASKTEIANMAISNLGTGKEIANLDNEQSQEANACRRFFEVARDATLLDYNWPFAKVATTLNLIEEGPNKEWGYSYRYPADCLKVIQIVPGKRIVDRKERRPFKIAKDNAGKIIYSNAPVAKIEYIQRIEDPNFFSSSFIIALSFRLAAYVAPRLTKGDPYKMRQEMLASYMSEIDTAKRNSANEGQDYEEPESSFIRARY
jgi:hypothetical protein